MVPSLPAPQSVFEASSGSVSINHLAFDWCRQASLSISDLLLPARQHTLGPSTRGVRDRPRQHRMEEGLMTLGSARVPSSSLPSALISRSQTAPSLIRHYVADAEMPDALPPSLALSLHSMPSASFLCSRGSRRLACHEHPSLRPSSVLTVTRLRLKGPSRTRLPIPRPPVIPGP